MKQPFLLLASSLLLAGTAQAQATFSVGPRVGLNVSAAHFPASEQASYTSRSGFEAGLTGTVQLGHFALQPSLLFSQKGYRSTGEQLNFDIIIPYSQDVRLHYLTLPLNFAFTQKRDGQGLQVIAGAYASLFVGGNFAQQESGSETTGPIKAGGPGSHEYNWYTRRLDGGLQAGVGYCLKGFQLQANYSFGLRNLAAQYQGYDGRLSENPAYYNRAFQLSLSYLVGLGS